MCSVSIGTYADVPMVDSQRQFFIASTILFPRNFAGGRGFGLMFDVKCMFNQFVEAWPWSIYSRLCTLGSGIGCFFRAPGCYYNLLHLCLGI